MSGLLSAPTLVPRHVARHVAWLIIDYSASSRLVVDNFAYAA
jgi:hypothetical protein